MKIQFRFIRHLAFSALIVSCFTFAGYSQEEYKDPKNKALTEVYQGGSFNV
jgi:hypothetical protein